MNILIADDDATARLWLESVLQGWGHRTVQAADGNEAWEQLQTGAAPDLVLIDWLMPGRDGIDICRSLKADPRTRACYVVMLTARAEADDIATALDAGADDLLAKPFEPAQLQLRLRLGERIVSLQRDLEARASHDELTGLHTRRLLMEMALRKFEEARRGDVPMQLLLLDIDGFQQVNDIHGHHVGDDVLREVGRRIQDTLRLGDVVGRYGGEEFLVILSQCAPIKAAEIAGRLRAAIAAPIVLDGCTLHMTASIGSAELAQNTLDLADWIAQAERALTQAKQQARL